MSLHGRFFCSRDLHRTSKDDPVFPSVIVFAFCGSVALSVGTGDARAGQVADEVIGNASRGAALIANYGCGGCHVIPGITGAQGVVGPPLDAIGRRVFIAGVLRNSPENMTAWLEEPQRFAPGNAMPNMGISHQDAQDITAYLYTLR